MLTRLILNAINAYFYVRYTEARRDYKRRQHRLPNITNPRSYTERMLWRKLIDHNPLFVVFSDKLATKKYCSSICPDLQSPETLWEGTDANEIPDEALTGDVYVKTNHGYNFNYRIRGGAVDRIELKATTDEWLKHTHGLDSDQWAYSQVAPKLFVERAIGDPYGDLLEINIRCCNGRFFLGSVIGKNKTDDMWAVYLDADGKPCESPDDEAGKPIEKLPDGVDIAAPYQRAFDYALKLSEGVDYARFDFMWNGQELYAGEITVYPSAGRHEIYHPGLNDLMLSLWDLRDTWLLKEKHTGWRAIYAWLLRREVHKRFKPASANVQSLVASQDRREAAAAPPTASTPITTSQPAPDRAQQ